MATHKPALYLLQVSSIVPEEGCLQQHVQCQVKWYLILVDLSTLFFDGHILELSVFIQSQSGSHMGSVHPLPVFFHRSGLRGACLTACWGKKLLVLTTPLSL